MRRRGRKVLARVISHTPLRKLVQLSRYIKQFIKSHAKSQTQAKFPLQTATTVSQTITIPSSVHRNHEPTRGMRRGKS